MDIHFKDICSFYAMNNLTGITESMRKVVKYAGMIDIKTIYNKLESY